MSIGADDSEGVIAELAARVPVDDHIEHMGIVFGYPFAPLRDEVILNEIEKLVQEKFVRRHHHCEGILVNLLPINLSGVNIPKNDSEGCRTDVRLFEDGGPILVGLSPAARQDDI